MPRRKLRELQCYGDPGRFTRKQIRDAIEQLYQASEESKADSSSNVRPADEPGESADHLPSLPPFQE